MYTDVHAREVKSETDATRVASEGNWSPTREEEEMQTRAASAAREEKRETRAADAARAAVCQVATDHGPVAQKEPGPAATKPSFDTAALRDQEMPVAATDDALPALEIQQSFGEEEIDADDVGHAPHDSSWGAPIDWSKQDKKPVIAPWHEITRIRVQLFNNPPGHKVPGVNLKLLVQTDELQYMRHNEGATVYSKQTTNFRAFRREIKNRVTRNTCGEDFRSKLAELTNQLGAGQHIGLFNRGFDLTNYSSDQQAAILDLSDPGAPVVVLMLHGHNVPVKLFKGRGGNGAAEWVGYYDPLNYAEWRKTHPGSATPAPLPTPSRASVAPDSTIAQMQLDIRGLTQVVQALMTQIDSMEQRHAAEMKDIVTYLGSKVDPEVSNRADGTPGSAAGSDRLPT